MSELLLAARSMVPGVRSIPLDLRYTTKYIHGLQPRDLDEMRHVLNKCKVAKITSGNDRGALILGKDLDDERTCYLGLSDSLLET